MDDNRIEHQDIRIGTMAGKAEKTADYIRQIAPHGFECFQINFKQNLPKGLTLPKLAKQIQAVLEQSSSGAIISSLGVFGNPIEDADTRKSFEKCIDHAHRFGTDLVCGFTGTITGQSVPDAIPAFKKVWSKLAKRAADKGVRIAFENCPMRGTWQSTRWNLAFNPAAWELMFDAVPAENMGLEWEPCHQMGQLIDPLPQLRKWIDKVFHIHGKDATVLHDIVAKRGILSGDRFFYHRAPGFGDTNWADVISILRMHGYRGAIDIEGWHDPVYCGDLEMTGQVHALRHLQHCRGGTYVVEPKV
ncbi:sugar phosphate isomerase/epimerase family protein [Phycisphaerales bacterium AB-hyl4]|uniref:Sugar phosphate isomerase/epimerase family protein n=1 Tax=Natronomicrosphaera hydrolytica TaxID=3242702 RepID=A0ABV4U3Q7_9BACT